MKIRGLDYGTYLQLRNPNAVNRYLRQAFERDIIHQENDGTFASSLCHVVRGTTVKSVERAVDEAGISKATFYKLEAGSQKTPSIRTVAGLLRTAGLTIEFREIR